MEKISWPKYWRAVESFRLSNLETMIDNQGLKGTIDNLIEICGEKAEHIRSSYQDETTAGSWDKDAKALQAVRSKLLN